MQSKTDGFLAELEAYTIEECRPRSFELYEEYSDKSILDTIRERKENFEKARFTIKRQLFDKVEKEVESFQTWLEKTKKLDPKIAHYIVVSLKSKLLRLPIGVQIAQLFDTILDKQIKKYAYYFTLSIQL